MKRFDYVRPQTCAEASGEMENGAVYMAGGSDRCRTGMFRERTARLTAVSRPIG